MAGITREERLRRAAAEAAAAFGRWWDGDADDPANLYGAVDAMNDMKRVLASYGPSTSSEKPKT